MEEYTPLCLTGECRYSDEELDSIGPKLRCLEIAQSLEAAGGLDLLEASDCPFSAVSRLVADAHDPEIAVILTQLGVSLPVLEIEELKA